MFGPTVLMACRMPLRKCLSQVSLAAALACAWQTGLAAGAADDLVELPFEELLETEVTGAAGFVREVTDAPSAVSVVTAEEIRQFGYRTLAEVLENLPGLVLDFDGAYYYLGTRGYGLPGQYFGRFMLLIDGYPAADNFYNQIFLGDEGLLDVSLIDRVEYAPGPGAGVYGNNAFLGAIHIFTRKGRDIQGGELAGSWGTNNDRKTRLNLGGRTGDGTDWVLSVADRNNDVQAWRYPNPVRFSSQNQNLFFKAARNGWWLEAALAKRQLMSTPTTVTAETYAFWQVGHDVDGKDWKASFRLHQGRYDYGDWWRENAERLSDTSEGAWWGGQAQLATTAWAGHRVVVGVEHKADQRLGAKFDVHDEADGALLYLETHPGRPARNLGVYLQDEIQLSPALDLSLALRHDRRSNRQQVVSRTNPRWAMVYRPGADTTLKFSHGTASRWSSWAEVAYGIGDDVEKVRTTELVVDQRWPASGLRVLGSAYRYRLSDFPTNMLWDGVQHVDFQGGELTLEWRWNGAVVKASYAQQSARTFEGYRLSNSPREVGKVQVSVPLASDRWRASLALRAVGERKSWLWEKLPGYGVADLTLLGHDVVKGLDLTLGVRNLFDRRYGSAVNPYLGERGVHVRDGRTYWLQLEYRFR